MRPPKPRIVKPRLIWRWDKHKAAWRPYHRIQWTDAEGKRRAREILLEWRGDPRALDDLYWQAQSGKHVSQKPRPSKYTWRALIEAWRSDPRIQGKLADSTKARYRRQMDPILEKNGHKDLRATTRQKVRAAHAGMSETPGQADKMLEAVKLLWNYAVKDMDWPLGNNPTEGIKPYGTQKPFKPWPEWMIAALPSAPENVQTAAYLILWTGQRPNAAITMKWADFDGEWMTVHDQKQGVKFTTYCPPNLREYLAQLPQEGAYVLAKNLTEALGYNSIEHAFNAWRKTLRPQARDYSLHGLRKLAIVRLAEAGATDAQIQAVTGQTAKTVAYYRSSVSKKRLSRDAQNLRNRT